MAFQKVQATIILQCVVAKIKEASSRLGVFRKNLPIYLHDLFRATSDGFGS
jgi:hypothetical protein